MVYTKRAPTRKRDGTHAMAFFGEYGFFHELF
jgi:hypothetical protein